MSMAVLRGEHAVLVELVRQLNRMVEDQGVAAADEILRVRAMIAKALLGHLAAEDFSLYPRLLASKDGGIVAIAKLFVEELGGLAAAFKDYMASWTPDKARADWPAFADESRMVFTLLAKRIERENRELYPLADREENAVPERRVA